MRQEAGQGMNFLEAIFSFVFGDGNPNESYEDRRWRLVSVACLLYHCLLLYDLLSCYPYMQYFSRLPQSHIVQLFKHPPCLSTCDKL